ncbi:HTH domain-containing protein [Polyangium jinanense]|uniref:HTH HARE-type domain-containing protein n=1 Tax=Polyangium jinanense TaxID=2829994 RepID=A0A9X3XDE4_9BACT|nr:HTH domain-containing protein [Polyangium jinanense]MDC3958922.1 hypothetical protein [Polyangium jinanense]MDC3986036.1 hypothetical protein [Polyangium jinanense]
MENYGWRDAAIKVLEGSAEPMHYADIAEAIAEQRLRSEFGATPAIAVNVAIGQSLKNDGENAPFIRVARGVYALRHASPPPASGPSQHGPNEAAESETDDDTGLINAFGMYWARANVLWGASPKILGQQQPESAPVNFCSQRGVYLLHDGRSVVYVGRTTDQPLGVRLRQHTADRLNGRWDRFSWFGISSVDEDGQLIPPASSTFNLDMLIVTMEALLIEGLEPPQNRKRGDDFRAIEYLQVEDPDIRKKNIIALIDELKTKL